jgi:CrcB protein
LGLDRLGGICYVSDTLPGYSLVAESIGHVGGRHMTYLLIGIGGFLGANARYLVGSWCTERFGPSFPYGTLVINVTGSFAIGFILLLMTERVIEHPYWRLLFVSGFLGAYTTFSTFSFETFALIQERLYLSAVANMAGSVLLSLIAVVFGVIAARLL